MTTRTRQCQTRASHGQTRVKHGQTRVKTRVDQGQNRIRPGIDRDPVFDTFNIFNSLVRFVAFGRLIDGQREPTVYLMFNIINWTGSVRVGMSLPG